MKLINNETEYFEYIEYAKNRAHTALDDFIVFIRTGEYNSDLLCEYEIKGYPLLMNWDNTEEINNECQLYFTVAYPSDFGLISKREYDRAFDAGYKQCIEERGL